MALACSPGALQARPAPEAIAERAACITHEGADLPVSATAGRPAGPAAGCEAAVLDGTVCDAVSGSAASVCFAKEIAIWDGVLDRLVSEDDTKRRQARVRDAVSAFRSYRDRACSAFEAIAINPQGPTATAGCRLTETTRFAQRLYVAFFSP